MLFRYVACFFIVLLILVIPGLSALKVEAEVAVFHSDTYLEEGAEANSETGTEKQVQYDYSWMDFKGVVPPESVVNSILLRFSWSLVTRSVVTETEASTSADTIGEGSATEESPNEVPVPEKPEEGSVIEEIAPESLTGAVLESSSEEPPVIQESQSSEDTIAPESMDLPSEENNDPSDTEGFEQVSRDQLFILADTQLKENLVEVTGAFIEEVIPEDRVTEEVIPEDRVTEEVIPEDRVTEEVIPEEIVPEWITPEVIIAESVSTTSGFVSEDMIVEKVDEKFFEVRYTTDGGATWNLLGEVGFDESHESVFDLSGLSLEALPNLQIAVRYTVPALDQTKIIFDSMRIEVEYGAPLVPELPIVEEVVNDQEPNFRISSIKADVHSENLRAVVIEKGGILEFWYSVAYRSSGNVEWQRLVGGSAIDAEAPIAIKERTIFWVDRNQQTLFGYSVDEQSIFGVPFRNAEEKTLLLPFEDGDTDHWQAIFNATENSLEFERVQDGK